MLSFLFKTPRSSFFLPITLLRIAIGLFFFSSGFNKTFVPENQKIMLQTITEAGIMFPEIMSVFVAGCETFFGLILALGLFSRLSAFVLLIISIVALITVGIHQIPADLNILTWYSWLFYLPESNYIVMFILLIIQGGGPYSLDSLFVKKQKP